MDDETTTGGTMFGGSPYLGGDYSGGSVMASLRSGDVLRAATEGTLIVSLLVILMYVLVWKEPIPQLLKYVAIGAGAYYAYTEVLIKNMGVLRV